MTKITEKEKKELVALAKKLPKDDKGKARFKAFVEDAVKGLRKLK